MTYVVADYKARCCLILLIRFIILNIHNTDMFKEAITCVSGVYNLLQRCTTDGYLSNRRCWLHRQHSN